MDTKQAKHTPGPWAIEPVAAALSPAQNDYLITHESEGLRSHVCRLFDASLCDEHGGTEANARLIAAAPDMLDALNIGLRWFGRAPLKADMSQYEADRGAFLAAIARAKGQP